MRYPKIEQVEQATREQLCEWSRFLPTPGEAGGRKDWHERVRSERRILNLILERLHDAGGMSPAISKDVGWDPR